MKQIYCTLIILFISVNYVFAQSWYWGNDGHLGSLGTGEGYSVSVDKLGNAYITGLFEQKITFDKIVLTSSSFGLYIVKYDSLGNVRWAKSDSASSAYTICHGNSIAADKKNNVYVVGGFNGIVYFDTIKLSTYNGAISMYASFLAKYNSSGKVLWAKQSDSTNNVDNAISVAVDNLDNAYVVGQFGGTIVFGSDSVKQGIYFIAKYDSAGKVVWAKGAKGSIWAKSVATDQTGDIYVTGYFSDSCTFGSVTLKGRSYNSFLTKYDANGNVLWASQSIPSIGGYPGTIGYSVTVDKANDIFITGTYSDTVSFGSYTFPSTGNPYYQNFFLVKYDAEGSVLWGKTANILDNLGYTGYTVATDNEDNIYCAVGGTSVSGIGHCSIAFGKDTLTIQDTSNDGPSVVVKFDSLGNALCGSIIPGGGDDRNALAIDPIGQYVYLTGDLENTVICGSDTLKYQGDEAPFVARWKACSDNLQSVNNIPAIKNTICVYPNPSNGAFNISIQDLTGKPHLMVYNMIGEKVYESTPTVSSTYINIGNKSTGIYLYRVISEQGILISSGKLIIQ